MSEVPRYDVVVIGAGMSGMYLTYRLRELGLSFRVYEAGTDLGGTWYWNRYPGARFDSESYTYGYSFSEELLEEWEWSEHFSAQPETLSYLNYVADKFDLRKSIQFETRIENATYDEAQNIWEIRTGLSECVQAKFLITAIGVLSAPYIPDFDGIGNFRGGSWHTSLWPHQPVSFGDKNVGVIGTGATAVQMIPEIAKDVGHLTVFQRTANYCVPAGNGPIDAETQLKIKGSYPEIWKRCSETFGCFLHGFDDRSALEVSPETRQAFYEELYQERGFALWLGNFADIMTNNEANETLAEFIREKIHARIDDPKVAGKLVPMDHAFGTKRVPLEHGYYEAYNRENVALVDIRATPIEEITAKGVRTTAAEYEFDIIIYATGFDAVTGAFSNINIRGEGGQLLNDKWIDGPLTYLGLQTAGFPNLFTVVGPHNGSTFCNLPRCIEQNVEWVTACLRYMRDNKIERINPTVEAEEAWTAHVNETVEGTLIPQTDSWFMGANIPGKKRNFLLYAGGSPFFREKCEEIVANGYEGFEFS